GSLRRGLRRRLLPGMGMRVRAVMTMTGMSVPGMVVSVAGVSDRTIAVRVAVVSAGQQVQTAVPQQGHRCKCSQQDRAERPTEHHTLTEPDARLSVGPAGKSTCG